VPLSFSQRDLLSGSAPPLPTRSLSHCALWTYTKLVQHKYTLQFNWITKGYTPLPLITVGPVLVYKNRPVPSLLCKGSAPRSVQTLVHRTTWHQSLLNDNDQLLIIGDEVCYVRLHHSAGSWLLLQKLSSSLCMPAKNS